MISSNDNTTTRNECIFPCTKQLDLKGDLALDICLPIRMLYLWFHPVQKDFVTYMFYTILNS